MKPLLAMTLEELTETLAAWGLPAFRARQVFQWVWGGRRTDPATMTNLPAALRAKLAACLPPLTGRIVRRTDAADGVVKLLLAWPDDQTTETVLIPTRPGEARRPRRTACVSTQVGCPIGCTFCASGLGGVRRNLQAAEIVEQVIQWDALPPAGPGDPDAAARVTHVVLMGTGEPLANYDAVVEACRILVDPDRGGLSGRHLTLSTVGYPDRIRRLAGEGIPLTLAISLHAPTDALRRRLIPAAAASTIQELVAAGKDYFERTGREVTLEYVLLADVNDSGRCADELAAIARQLRCNVNLIRYNEVAELPCRRPSDGAVRRFRDRLSEAGVNVQIRASRGADADAACGQLRRRAGTS
ncbi:MAG: 23S rRNA (adenine(2503)-C(2))-methyltransferase RlmN [Planctomycetes bacterium]|nr:23S rRNA (adenine(2503)-C(2))-methyltransferase RlmN [Planctomycetota bacterium]